MDIARPNVAKEKRRKRIVYAVITVAVLAAITVLLMRLKPAAPTVEKNLVWMDQVKRGPMVRQVRGLGTLVPEEIRWIAARTQGRVDKIVIRPGAPVEPGTLILELSNPDVVSNAANAKSQLLAAEAQLAGLRVTLESGLLQAESTAAAAKSNFEQARLQAEVNDELFKDGLVSPVQMKLSKVSAEEAATRHEIEQKRYAFAKQSIKPQLAVQEAEVERLAAEAQLAGLRVTLESGLLQAESTAAAAKSNFEQARLQAEVNDELFKDGLVSPVQMKLSKVSAEEAATRHEIEQKRYAFAKQSIKPQLAVQEAEVERLASLSRLRNEELEALQVRATMSGVLSALGTPNLPIEVGAQVQPGNNIARVADPLKLKAEIRIAETQAKDIAIGQLASIDTRNGIVEGRVSRIDPAVQNGTVLVDVTIVNALPRGSRPDLSVDGTIELERLDDVVYVGRPAFGQEKSIVGIFKANGDKLTSTEASRVQVQLGRSSVNTIEILNGLQPGEWVILSDTSAYDSNERIRLN